MVSFEWDAIVPWIEKNVTSERAMNAELKTAVKSQTPFSSSGPTIKKTNSEYVFYFLPPSDFLDFF